jgi:V/A-type H+-transporting ATPase subunit E
MGIEKITSSLLADAKKEADEILGNAELSAERMLSQEKSKRTLLLSQAEEQVEKTLEEHRRERLAWARLEAKRISAEAKEDAIKGVFDDLFEMLGEVRKSDEYKKFMKSAVSSAIAELKGKDVVVHCIKGEKSLLPSEKAKAIEGLEATGGAVVETADGKIRIDLTLEALLGMKREALRKQIYLQLFGEDLALPRKENRAKKKR